MPVVYRSKGVRRRNGSLVTWSVAACLLLALPAYLHPIGYLPGHALRELTPHRALDITLKSRLLRLSMVKRVSKALESLSYCNSIKSSYSPIASIFILSILGFLTSKYNLNTKVYTLLFLDSLRL